MSLTVRECGAARQPSKADGPCAHTPAFEARAIRSLRADGSRERAPDDRLRKAIHKRRAVEHGWIASSPMLLAMTHGATTAGGQAAASFLFWRCCDEIVDHGGIRQGRGVAEAARLVLGDLAQDAAHDLAGAGLRQARCELDLVGRRDRADVLAHPRHQFLAQLLARLGAGSSASHRRRCPGP